MREKMLPLRTIEAMTGLTRQTLYKRLKDGRLKGFRMDNGTWRVAESELEKILGLPPIN
jgi:predicted site-specific integrase-resolvase